MPANVVCNVTDCKYWEEGNHCTAEEITVSPEYARTQANSQTLCQTFVLADYSNDPNGVQPRMRNDIDVNVNINPERKDDES